MGGIILPVLPGLVLQLLAMVLWAFEESTTLGWLLAGLAVTVGVTATVYKYLHPGRRLRGAGIPGWLLFVAVVAGVIGFFAIPIVGAPIAFVLAIYLFQLRKRDGNAWASTKTAIGAVLQSVGIELAGGFVITLLLIAGIWLS